MGYGRWDAKLESLADWFESPGFSVYLECQPRLHKQKSKRGLG